MSLPLAGNSSIGTDSASCSLVKLALRLRSTATLPFDSFRDGVSEMAEVAVPSGHVPSAPALVHGNGVSRQAIVAGVSHRASVPIRIDRLGEGARHVVGGVPGMATQTAPGAGEEGAPLLVEGPLKIEHRPEFGVEAGDLDPTAWHPAQVDLVVEVDGPWVARADLVALQTGLAEDKNLRVLVEVQLAQHALDERFADLLIDHELACGETGHQLGHGVLHLRREVVVWRRSVIVVELRGDRYRSGETPEEGEEGESVTHDWKNERVGPSAPITAASG